MTPRDLLGVGRLLGIAIYALGLGIAMRAPGIERWDLAAVVFAAGTALIIAGILEARRP